MPYTNDKDRAIEIESDNVCDYCSEEPTSDRCTSCNTPRMYDNFIGKKLIKKQDAPQEQPNKPFKPDRPGAHKCRASNDRGCGGPDCRDYKKAICSLSPAA